jgi:hypothetical protein
LAEHSQDAAVKLDDVALDEPPKPVARQHRAEIVEGVFAQSEERAHIR